MASNLYEVLQVNGDATVEQIRKAYKKKALQTHPDRLPQGSNQEEKKAAEERFRQVNHAYEVLTDPEKRKEYDAHGVWPPPEPEEENLESTFFSAGFPGRHRGQRGQTFPNHFSHHHHPFSTFAFRDPFELFESIFRDFEDDEFFGPPHVHSFVPLNPFGGMRGFHSNSFFGPSLIPGISFNPLEPTFESNRGRGANYVSESFTSSTVNGVTETIHTRRDSNGNEHVTRTYNDGRKVYTINGIEQPPRGSLPQTTPEPRQLPQSSNNHYLPPLNHPRRSHTAPQQRRPSRSGPQQHNAMPSYFESQHPQPQSRGTLNRGGGYHTTLPAQQPAHYNMPSQREYDAPPPPYPGNSTTYPDRLHNQAPAAEHQRHRERRSTDKYASSSYGEQGQPEDRHRKRWFPRGPDRH